MIPQLCIPLRSSYPAEQFRFENQDLKKPETEDCQGTLWENKDALQKEFRLMSDTLPKCLDKCQYWIESRDECLPPLCKQAAITQNQYMPVLHATQRG
jgi:hypothetical protein